MSAEEYYGDWYTVASDRKICGPENTTYPQRERLRSMRTILKVAVLSLLLISPFISKADSISENFNALTPALNATNIGAFTVTGGAVDVVGGALFGYLCVTPTSGSCVDLDGSTGAAGQISSANLTLGPGVYNLSFDLIGSQRGNTTSTTVTLGSLFNQTFILSSGDVTDGVVNTTFTVGTATIVPLVFSSNTPGNMGALLDNVSLTPGTVATPEPTTLSLLGLGLFGLIVGRRRATAK
jgi:hypothetical protein